MTARALMVLPLALGLAASGATAQVCREASTGVRVHADAGHVRYAFADGTDGWEVGGGLSWASERVGVSATAFTTSLDGAETSPLGARAGVSFRALEVVGWSLCIDLLGGATRFSADDDSGTTVAGGGGVSVARALSLGGAELVPFGGVRGLAAAVSGEVLGVDIAESGGGLGGEVGVALVRGSAEVRLTASMDGLAAGLGAVPFPDRAVRASLGWRF